MKQNARVPTAEVRGLLSGLIMADGYIGDGLVKREFVIKNSDKDFIDNAAASLSKYEYFDVATAHEEEHFDGGINYKEGYVLHINPHVYMGKIYLNYYDKDHVRLATEDSIASMSAEGLAYWYMARGYIGEDPVDEGEINSHIVMIDVHEYDVASLRAICRELEKSFYIRSRIEGTIRNYSIRLLKKSVERFFSMIRPYITDAYLYKLNLGYDQQPVWMSDGLFNMQKEVKKKLYGD